MALERLQAHEGQEPLDQQLSVAFDPHEVGKPVVVHDRAAEHADR